MAWPRHYFGSPPSQSLIPLEQDAYAPLSGKLTKGQETSSSLGELCFLIILAVSEVILITLAGYNVARMGLFDADKRKFLNNLNIKLFTPCLIFSMLASQLNTAKLSDLAIIPAIFIVQLLVSLVAARIVSKTFHFGRRASNFIIAMSVFPNSNSLPPPLVLSLSRTLKGLYWDRIPGDNNEEVAARGIFYLVIFQQLSHLLRWSWGYHVLLAPKHKFAEYQEHEDTEVGQNYRDEPEAEPEQGQINNHTQALVDVRDSDSGSGSSHCSDSQNHEPASRMDVTGSSRSSLPDIAEELGKPTGHPTRNGHDDSRLLLPRVGREDDLAAAAQGRPKSLLARARHSIGIKWEASRTSIAGLLARLDQASPSPIRAIVRFFKYCCNKTITFLVEVMNPPLWGMLLAVLVASFPGIQRALFENEYLQNSVTSAIRSTGNVAVPLMLVGLGANLGRDPTAEKDEEFDPEEERIGTRLLVASLVSRMVIPTLVLAPLMFLTVKYVNVAILEDPIFVIVCYLLSGAPTALQLAQICQINGAFEKTMDRILFHSYAIWLLPSTLVLVMLALGALQWAR
ncbi:auxin efflux carrier [Aspergillus lucknowensis]|uniref:Auxin efflux carrier n=1 Tax=Aspergillus lucknowensis TaxID=176173 RepID=A0ABR4LSR7_9EURO